MSTDSLDLGKGIGGGDGFAFLVRVLYKAALLFLVFNLGYIYLQPRPFLAQFSLYNTLLPGRERLPYSDDPTHSFNMSIPQLDAMFNSHVLAGSEKAEDEFRVILIGDSSIWGFLLRPGETLAANLSARNLRTSDGRTVRAYNLGYPTMSATKDLLILESALAYQPDLILWFITLESLTWESQLQAPLLLLNPVATNELIEHDGLANKLDPLGEPARSWWARSMIGERRELADWIRFQLYGIAWAATSVDHVIPETYNQRMEDLPADAGFQSFTQGSLTAGDLAFDVLTAGIKRAGDIPVLVINEPIFVSQGANSAIRYNFYYPRWAYDTYRALLIEAADEQGWQLMDYWDSLPPSEFTDSAIHYTPDGVDILADQLSRLIVEQ